MEAINEPKNDIGNILSKTGLGAYTYGSARPHAVTGVENTGYVIQEHGLCDTVRGAAYRLQPLGQGFTHRGGKEKGGREVTC